MAKVGVSVILKCNDMVLVGKRITWRWNLGFPRWTLNMVKQYLNVQKN